MTCAAWRVRYAEDHAPSGLPAGRRSPRAPMTDLACSAAASAALAICANRDVDPPLPPAPAPAPPFLDLPLAPPCLKSFAKSGDMSPMPARSMDGHRVPMTSVSSRTFGDRSALGVFTAANRSSSAALARLFAGLPPAGTFLDPRLDGSSSTSNCLAGRLRPAAAMFAALPIAVAFRPGLPFSATFLSLTVFSVIFLPRSLAGGLGLGAGSANAWPMGTSSMSSSMSSTMSGTTTISDFFTRSFFLAPGLDLPGLFSFPSSSATPWSFFASLAASTAGSFGLRLRSGSGALTMVFVCGIDTRGGVASGRDTRGRCAERRGGNSNWGGKLRVALLEMRAGRVPATWGSWPGSYRRPCTRRAPSGACFAPTSSRMWEEARAVCRRLSAGVGVGARFCRYVQRILFASGWRIRTFSSSKQSRPLPGKRSLLVISHVICQIREIPFRVRKDKYLWR